MQIIDDIVFLRRSGQPNQAIAAATQFLRGGGLKHLDNTSLSIFLNEMVQSHLLVGQKDEAEALCNQALKLNLSNTGFAHKTLAKLSHERGDLNAADQHYTMAVKMLQDDYVLHNAWAKIAQQRGDLQEADRRYAVVVEKFPNEHEAFSTWLTSAQSLGDKREFFLRLGIAVQRFPSDVSLRLAWAQETLARGMIQKAEKRFADGIELFPRNVELCRGGAEAALRMNQFDTAKQRVLEAIHLSPGHWKDYAILGAIALRCDDERERESLIDTAIHGLINECQPNDYKNLVVCQILINALPKLGGVRREKQESFDAELAGQQRDEILLEPHLELLDELRQIENAELLYQRIIALIINDNRILAAQSGWAHKITADNSQLGNRQAVRY